jgi:hypothetical protein
MLSKCANPDCSARFRYLHEGKLYSIDFTAVFAGRTAPTNVAGRSSNKEYFWLCALCSREMTIRLDQHYHVLLAQKPGTKKPASPISVSSVAQSA